MALTQIDTKELRKIIREEMRKATHEILEKELALKMMELRLQLVPSICEEEMREIEQFLGEPGKDDVAETLILEHK